MTIKEIKQAIKDGKQVMLYNDAYEVMRDDADQYLIIHLPSGHAVGLHGVEGTEYENEANFPLADFYIKNAPKEDFNTAKAKADKYAGRHGEINLYTVITKNGTRRATSYTLTESINACNEMPKGAGILIENHVPAFTTLIYTNNS